MNSVLYIIKRLEKYMENIMRIVKGILLGVVLIISTIVVFLTDHTPYWNDIAFIVWCLTIVITIDMFDRGNSK